MNVLIVNTSERTGGAAVAARRLMVALNNNGVKAHMLVRDKQSDSIHVTTVGNRWLNTWRFCYERLVIWLNNGLNWKTLFKISIANSGIDITKTREFQNADVIHLHWVNQGLLSLRDIRKILRSGKAVVWTMHDAWPAVSICHLTMGCRAFTSSCHHCKYLPHGGSKNDLAARVWQRKERMLRGSGITMVACSRWLESEAKRSGLLRDLHVTSIPNPIDTGLYRPANKTEARQAEGLPTDRKLMMFVCQNLLHPNKGMDYLIEACTKLAQTQPSLREQLSVVLLGSHADDVAERLPFPAIAPGYIADEARMARLYQSADVFVLPSLSENLPNTIMEAMACGVPCVGFRVGGIPEMIDHRKNGYVAVLRDSDDLARGIGWVLLEADYAQLSNTAVKKVTHTYSQSSVALRYIEVYQHQLAQSNLKL